MLFSKSDQQMDRDEFTKLCITLIIQLDKDSKQLDKARQVCCVDTDIDRFAARPHS